MIIIIKSKDVTMEVQKPNLNINCNGFESCIKTAVDNFIKVFNETTKLKADLIEDD